MRVIMSLCFRVHLCYVYLHVFAIGFAKCRSVALPEGGTTYQNKRGTEFYDSLDELFENGTILVYKCGGYWATQIINSTCNGSEWLPTPTCVKGACLLCCFLQFGLPN